MPRVFRFPGNQPTILTDKQEESLFRIAERWNLPETMEVSPMFGGDGAVIVNVGTMWLAVETDGYTHS